MAQEDIKKLILEVLDKSYLASLATVDDGGVWVADVICIHDNDLNLYWMSHPATRLSSAVVQNGKMAGTITVSGPGEDNFGIQFSGTAEKIDGPRYDLAKLHYKKRNKPEPSEDEDVLEGDNWYKLKLEKVELICERLFGFEKKKIDFN